MTKEPIMIDKVDVSECKLVCHYTKDRTYCNATDSLCKEEPNCYYKQLKIKEQECEELKKSVRSNKEKRKRAIERYLKLKEFTNKEFEKLEVELKEFKDMAKQGLDNYKDVGGCWGCGISFSFDELLNSYKKLEKSYFEATKESPTATRINAKFNKYEQALQEIKEIAEKIIKECDNCDQYSCSGCPDENKEKLAQQILQKCEVIDD